MACGSATCAATPSRSRAAHQQCQSNNNNSATTLRQTGSVGLDTGRADSSGAGIAAHGGDAAGRARHTVGLGRTSADASAQGRSRAAQAAELTRAECAAMVEKRL